MAPPRASLGDSHNFGRRVTARGDRILKPRTIVWEQLVLAADSPLRRALDAAAREEGVADAFAFLPDLAFFPDPSESPRAGGEVQRLALDPIGDASPAERLALARIVGRSLALWSFLGVADLHWENLALGRHARDGRDARAGLVLAPLDVEMILDDLARPTETKLLGDADPEIARVVRHAAGARRALPFLGKPVPAEGVVTIAGAYLATLALLERHAAAIAEAFASVPALREAPIRVCLRGTDEYVGAASRAPWPPLLDAEIEQMDRGDVPYFFRLYGRPGIHWFADAALDRIATLPRTGDVPSVPPLLSLARALRSPSRAKLREEGLFTVLGAFDHPGLAGAHAAEGLSVTFRGRSIVATLAHGEELEVGRDLSAFVGSLYLPCACGEVATPLVPKVTVCDAAAITPPRTMRARKKRGSRGS